MQQMRQNERDSLHRFAFLAAKEQAAIPDLTLKSKKLARGWSGANLDLQLNKWAYEDHFAGAVIDKETGDSLEYRDLMKLPKYKAIWSISLANKFERLAQGICDVPGTDTILSISK